MAASRAFCWETVRFDEGATLGPEDTGAGEDVGGGWGWGLGLGALGCFVTVTVLVTVWVSVVGALAVVGVVLALLVAELLELLPQAEIPAAMAHDISEPTIARLVISCLPPAWFTG